MIKKKIFAVLMVVVPCLTHTSTKAQYLPIYQKDSSSCLFLNIDQIWKYNLYEHSRFGVGLTYKKLYRDDSPLLLSVYDGYIGYGIHDKKLKGGLFAQWQANNEKKSGYNVGLMTDNETIAQRNTSESRLVDIGRNGTYMQRKMNHIDRIFVGYSWQNGSNNSSKVAYSFSHEVPLYCNNSLIYPCNLYSDSNIIRHYISELSYIRHYSNRWTTLSSLGYYHDKQEFYLRMLVEYSQKHTYKVFTTTTLFQTGLVIGATGNESRYFDLGGTMGCPLALENTLLTAYPNEVLAEGFILGIYDIRTSKPLWDMYDNVYSLGTSPTPLLHNALAIGVGDGIHSGCIVVPSLHYEVGAGVDGIIRWGLTNFGGMICYGYQSRFDANRDKRQHRLTYMLTLHLAL